MTYREFIENILNTRGRFNFDNIYERHHILPKCLGGTDDENNLIDLYPKEHYEAHRLLALENPNENKLTYAWHMMSIMGNVKVTTEEYEEARIAFINSQTGQKRSDETKKKMSRKRRKMDESVCQYDKYGNLIKVWDNASVAAKELSLNATKIRNCCTGKKYKQVTKYKNGKTKCKWYGRKTEGGFIWKFLDKK